MPDLLAHHADLRLNLYGRFHSPIIDRELRIYFSLPRRGLCVCVWGGGGCPAHRLIEDVGQMPYDMPFFGWYSIQTSRQLRRSSGTIVSLSSKDLWADICVCPRPPSIHLLIKATAHFKDG